VVVRLGGCLDAVPARTRRVLVLRSGLGPATRHSRAGVASVLDLTVRRVARIERRGLRTLRRLDRTRGCGPALPSEIAALAPIAAAAGGAHADLAVYAPASADRSSGGAAGDATAAGSGDQTEPVADGAGGVLGSSAVRTPPTAVAPLAEPAGTDPAIAIMLIALAIAAGAGVFALRREPR
jgi:hypothetical protein